jgi:hypothetical protein
MTINIRSMVEPPRVESDSLAVFAFARPILANACSVASNYGREMPFMWATDRDRRRPGR